MDSGDDPGSSLADAARRAGVSDTRVLHAVASVDRRLFVPPTSIRRARQDAPIPIGGGQTTSQPSLIAMMVEALEVGRDDRVLEIGGGFGYQTALLAKLVREVWSIEREAGLAAAAQDNLASAGIDNAHVIIGDGIAGLPEQAPYNGIIVSAATPTVPDAWKDQLSDGGRLVAPIGPTHSQQAEVLRKDGEALVTERVLVPVRFVPLRPWR